ncbi:MAG: WYL domain-containing protein [Lachnospiraceae bacterium]|nr:WYL domain-containing protein [Lachnospiraceae bacterium]
MKEKNTIKDVSVSQRQIYILSLLSENPRGYQAEEIRTRLHGWDIDVSRRTILRDIDELSLNYGIMEEERDGKTFYWADKYTLKNVDLTIEDLASLAFAKKVLGEYSHLEMGSHAVSFIDKMVENSASLNKMQFDKLMDHFKLNSAAGSADMVDKEVEMKIQNAIDNKNKIEIEYYSFASDEVSQRIIHPYGLLLLDSYLCMEGFCELRNEIRRFRLSRIEELNVLDEHYTEDIAERKEQPFLKLIGSEEEDIELVFYGESARYIAEYEVGRAKRIEKKDDGLYFYQRAAVTDDVVKWIRGFGLEVKVVSPAWLSEQLLEEARERVRIYDN